MDTRGAKSKPRSTDGKKLRDAGDIAKILSLAEYEIHQDPYRGIVNNDRHSPWVECQSSGSEFGVVFQVCSCSCPSLISWTRELDVLKRRKKRKRPDNDSPKLGRRREDPNFECPCDHNPFCLASIGGAMDDFLAQALVLSTQKEEDERMSDSSDVQIIGVADFKEMGDQSREDSKLPAKRETLDECDEVQIIDCKRVPSEDVSHAAIAKADLRALTDRSRTPSEAFLDDVAFRSEELDHTNGNCIYTKMTKEQLNAIRRDAYVDIDPICAYAESIVLPNAGAVCTQKIYCERLRSLHDRMLFINPLKDNSYANNQKMKFAVPPGMQNLGATCYLNTQLQCLARNTAFLDGIFTWKPSKSESRMDSVLSKLQQILARLAYSAEATTTTEEFAEALGLQNDEMQDPNEFARLLFQRMHEAFQQCTTQRGESGDQSLSTLLPTLFEGVMTYETKCQSCGKIRERSEKFMDINLSIVHTGGASKKGKGGQLQIEEAFAATSKDKETCVQFCLDSYMCPEELTDENQYWCENCGQKQDATRQVVFSKLPPVLNMQLCRYVYDRKKQTKKKLTDSVLLPQRLNVKSKLSPVPTSYRLCAVMKHLGNSAYRGHYIAEAMDWQTGIWFEFDDDKVKILENGPSCSTDDDTSAKKTRKKGSQDAYNMYYVSESFLGTCAMNSTVNDKIEEKGSAIHQVESERQVRYGVLADMCRNDGKAAERRKRRKRGLVTLLSKSFLSDSYRVKFLQQAETFQGMVWVDGGVLRSVFACGAEKIEQLLQKVMQGELHACEHTVGLHPRVARCGKLLPAQVYNHLVSLLCTEQDFLNKTQSNTETRQKVLMDCYTSDRVHCDTCASSYTGILRQKLELLQSLQTLYHDLDPKSEGSTMEADDDVIVYALSKRFITKFRKAVAAVLKKLESFATVVGGLDTLDSLSSFSNGTLSFSEGLSSEDELDIYVNSAIVCDSGKCCPANKRAVRYVSEQLWYSIRKHFPLAITLKKPTCHQLVWVRCKACEGSNKELESLENWAGVVTSGLSLELLKGRREHNQILPNVMESADYCLVHKSDVEKLWTAYKLVVSNNGTAASLKLELEQILFDHSSKEDRGESLSERLLKKWRPVSLLCANHKLVLNPVIMSPKSSQDEPAAALLWEYSSNVALFPEGEYRHYILVVLKLFQLLFPASSAISTCLKSDNISDSTIDALEYFLTSSYHPRARSQVDDERNHCVSDVFSLLSCSIGEAIVETLLMPAMCADQQCNFDCAESLRNNSATGGGGANSKKKALKVTPGAVVSIEDHEVHVINVDAPKERVVDKALVQLRLVEVDAGTKLEEFAKSLSVAQSEITVDNTVRRSNRKRKQRYHVGPVKAEHLLDLRKGHNFAAVRLHILEKDPSFKVDELIFMMLPTNTLPGRGESKISTVAIPFDWNNRLMSQVVADATEILQLSTEDMDRLLADAVLVHHASTEVTSNRRSAKGKEEEVQQAALVDSLLQVANLNDQNNSEATSKEKTSNNRVERGFTGTFLHSALQVTPNSESEKSVNGEITDCEKEADSLMKQSDAAYQDTNSPCEAIESNKKVETNGVFFDKKLSNEIGKAASEERITNHEIVDSKVAPTKGNMAHSGLVMDILVTDKLVKIVKSSGTDNSNQNKAARHGLVMDELVKVVNSSGTDNFDQIKFLDAVTWAIETSSFDVDIRDLTDRAYAKYLE